MHFIFILILTVSFNSLAFSPSEKRPVEFVEVHEQKKNDSVNFTIGSDNASEILYAQLDTKLYELSKSYERLNSSSATKEELRTYHSHLISFKKDLDTVNEVVRDRLNDIFFWGNLFFALFTILLAIGGFFIISNNKKVAKESAEEWCSSNLNHEKEKFNKELRELKDIAISDCEQALEEVFARKNELSQLCADARSEMNRSAVTSNGAADSPSQPDKTVEEGDGVIDIPKANSKKDQTLEKLKGFLNN